MAKKPTASETLALGEGAFAWADMSSEDAIAALHAATGCTPAELAATLRHNPMPVVPAVGSILCADADAVIGAWIAGGLPLEQAKVALIERLETLQPPEVEADGDA